jgi:hypothetical protein
VDDERDVAVFEYRLASDCEREFAVEASCDCRLFGISFTVVFVVAGGLASEFNRRSMPPTAYETGYVKNEDARCGVLRGGEGCDSPVVEDIAWIEKLELQWKCSCERKAGRVRTRFCRCRLIKLTRR